MLGHDEPEALRDQIDQLKTTSAAREEDLSARIERLTDVLGDLFLLAEPGAARFDWEDTQTEFHARGFEAILMNQAKNTRDACTSTCGLIKRELAALGLDPRQVGSRARSRRQTEERRARAVALRAEADRLERE